VAEVLAAEVGGCPGHWLSDPEQAAVPTRIAEGQRRYEANVSHGHIMLRCYLGYEHSHRCPTCSAQVPLPNAIHRRWCGK
jgi:hypothetical protein